MITAVQEEVFIVVNLSLTKGYRTSGCRIDSETGYSRIPSILGMPKYGFSDGLIRHTASCLLNTEIVGEFLIVSSIITCQSLLLFISVSLFIDNDLVVELVRTKTLASFPKV